MKVITCIALAIVGGTVPSVALHYYLHGVVNVTQVSLAVFIVINLIISFWEIVLGWNITRIHSDYKILQEKYKSERLKACMDLFLTDIPSGQELSPKIWSRIWSTYALYDPSYANRESFGFFIGVC